MAQALAHRPAVQPRSRAADELLLRKDLRRQIGRLEAELAQLWSDAFPRSEIDWKVGAAGGPRLLGSADLERVRDALVVRMSEARRELALRTDAEEANRELVERMIVDPRRYRWARVSNEALGERECKHWHSRPRWGILGMLLGWWRVKISSGCPLAGGGCPSEHTPSTEYVP